MKEEIRIVPFEDYELRAAADGGVGVAAGCWMKYNSPSIPIPGMGFREIILPGAMDAVLAANPDVRCLGEHSPGHLLGRTSSGTLKLDARPDGMYFEDNLPDTSAGRDTAVLLRRKDIKGCSYRATVAEGGDRFERREGVLYRIIRKFKNLAEVTLTQAPCYEDTTAALRSVDEGAILRSLQVDSDAVRTRLKLAELSRPRSLC